MKKSLEDVLRYISEELKRDPAQDKMKLINRASQKFDLDPADTQFLIEQYIGR